MKKLLRTCSAALIALGSLTAVPANAAWGTICLGDTCMHCNSNGFCVICGGDGSCKIA